MWLLRSKTACVCLSFVLILGADCPAEISSEAELQTRLFEPGEVSFTETAGLFSQVIQKNSGTSKAKEAVEAFAREIRPSLHAGMAPAEIVEVLKYFIYEKWGFRVRLSPGSRPQDGYYDSILRFAQESPEEIYRSSFLIPVLKERKGNCLGLTSFYVALAEALHLPIYPVFVPYHVFPRYDDGKIKINIESTARGRVMEDADYIKLCHIPASSVDHEIYLKTLSYREAFSVYYLALGSWYAGRGLAPKARIAYEDALRLSPNLALAYSNLAFIYAYYGISSDWAGQARAAIRVDPSFLGGYLSLAGVLYREGQLPDAIAVMQKTVKNHPDVAHAHAFLGELLLAEGRFDDAQGAIEKAVQIAPHDPEFYAAAAKVYYYKKDYARAHRCADQARSMGLNHHIIFLLLKRDPKVRDE